MDSAMNAPHRVPGRYPEVILPVSKAGRKLSTADLVGELHRRYRDDDPPMGTEDLRLLQKLSEFLREKLNVDDENRFSRTYVHELFLSYYGYHSPERRPNLKGATVLDMGCGSDNPFSFVFLTLLLGAKRGIAIDLANLEHEGRACRAMADIATWMLLDPESMAGEHAIPPSEAMANVASFDLARLSRGDPDGIDRGRLEYRCQSVQELSDADASVDLSVSTAFLEHVPDPAKAVEEIARVTRPGGMAIHNIDCADHGIYNNEVGHPLAFLQSSPLDPLVRDSNRLRPRQFLDLFERAGFDVLLYNPYDTVEINDALRASLVMPFRDMDDEVLSEFRAVYVLRKPASHHS